MDFARTETPLHDGRNKSGEGRRVEEPTAARGGRDERRGIQLAVGPQPLRLRNHDFGLVQRIMVKRLATTRHDPLGITDSACKNQLVVVSVQYGPFNTYIPIRSMTIGKSRVARDPIAMHTSWRSNSDIASVTSIGYPRMKASGESSTTKHRLLYVSGPHPIPPPNDPK
ncbi:carboxyl-terminal-processing peptidase 1, chloroplastic [Dorcoceras hygrometricum]|uniref:Carboxyl-terminal-processing peptidase 1, chloroplastic n=1 Tax=Dorcoceras hygrometricum TaxID=472368 RepID=A0A2Z7AHK6_9LAMI|nr:carboxyl-terminal-processing peptidase 1, chloroplastic [Dorcoceras hygrometricum]